MRASQDFQAEIACSITANGRALKRALTVLGTVGNCRHLLSIVGLISSFDAVMLFGDAAFREVSAAERFRRVFWLLERGFTCSIPTLASNK